MPGKSHRRKGKYSIQSKKLGGTGRPNPVVQQPSAAQVHQITPISSPPASPSVLPDSPRVIPARPARGAVHVQMDKPVAIRFAFVTKELRTIGILSALMLILLIVLARVLA